MSDVPRIPKPRVSQFFTVPLPSRGKFYGDDLLEHLVDGEDGVSIEVRPLKGTDEAYLTSRSMDAIGRINAMVESAIVNREIKIDSLLSDDRFAILVYLRARMADRFAFSLQCQSCREQFKTEVSISSDLDMKFASDDATDPFTISLPYAENELTVRHLRVKDESRITKEIKARRLRNANPEHANHELLTLAYQVTAIDGETYGIPQVEGFLREIDLGDYNHLRNSIREQSFGIDLDIIKNCSHCGFANETTLPFNAEFFRPSTV